MHLRMVTATFLSAMLPVSSALSIVEASIEELQTALERGQVNAVQLAAKHLHRVAQYDRRGPRLNALPVLNTLVFEHAQDSDSYRALHGTGRSQLEGIPGTLKDSYMMEGVTVASGSPAFVNLTASSDAFTTTQLRAGGAVILGKTNMPPMANGGMQRGVYGRAESPYNRDFLTAAYASGSSNGAGTSTSSSMGAFAMAEETVSSGRSPASNNALVAYTPSRGVLSIRGNWPLFPAADVVVPYARTVSDLFHVLDVIVEDDDDKTLDFWRGQPFIELPLPSEVRPNASYATLADPHSLAGKRIGIPKMYIGKEDPDAIPIWVADAVLRLWKGARDTLESLGATVEEVGFPVVTQGESLGVAEWQTEYPLPGFKDTGRPPQPDNVAAYAYDDFLAMVNDTSVSGITGLTDAEPSLIFPLLPGALPDRYGNRLGGDRTAGNALNVERVRQRNGTDIYDLPGLEDYLRGAEDFRKQHLEDWMDKIGLDAVVFPAAGDVGREDAETNETSAEHAWRNGVFFSNGNYAIRSYGIPTVTVPMGMLEDSSMPMGLTFASKAYDDNALLSYGYAFEKAHTARRVAPPRTPELRTDEITQRCVRKTITGTKPPALEADATRLEGEEIKISGTVDTSIAGKPVLVEVFVDGVEVDAPEVDRNGSWSLVTRAEACDDPVGDVPVRFVNSPDQGLAMVTVVATARNGRSSGKLLFV